ncbi:MAG: NAD(P)/FAD-dependent oxidoreductase [Chloroflexi bacterium]|nr:NAD(P)/FAD-dependent oxidoreductase [Chloroflexota bacterium]
MSQTQYDAIIVGAGHNGLTAAAYLAQAGHRVLVVEQRPLSGGVAATEEVWPGFHVNTGAPDAGLFPETIVRELFLKMHGLEFRQGPTAVFAPQPHGHALTLWHDETQTVQDIAHFNQLDAARYPAFVRQVARFAAIWGEIMAQTPPDLMALDLNDAASWGKIGWQLKRLGDHDMMEFLRVLPLALSDYLDEWFEGDALKGALAVDGLVGSQLGPRSAGTTLLFFYRHANGFMNGRIPRGGMGQLSAALAAAAQSYGAVICTGTAVQQILVNDDDQATGVRLADGAELTSRVILSSADPRRTLFGLIGPQKLEPRFMRAVRSIIYRGCTAKVNLALSGLPEFVGQTTEAQLTGRIRIAPDLTYLEKAYDAAKYGRISPHPFLDATIPSLLDPTLAPAGQHIMGITMQYAPYALRSGDWQTERERLGDLIIQTMAQYAPDLPLLIGQRQVLTPLDWEQMYGLAEGSIHHGQMGLEQLLVMRPVSAWGQYRTPIKNVYLCGAGAHPGGGVTGAPGRNAAREVLSVLPKR